MDTAQIDSILPARWNPRQHADETALEALTLSVKDHGIIQPVVVRPITDHDAASLELVAGSRRLEAAKRAGLSEVPIVIRDLDDIDAAVIAMDENIQSEALSPLDEAGGYLRLTEAGKSFVWIASTMGITVSRIRRRLRLLGLEEEVREYLASGRITLAHADLLTRVPNEQQAGAIEEACQFDMFGYADRECSPPGKLRQWIARNVKVDLDEDIVTDYFPELLAEIETPAEAVPTLLKLSESHHVNVDLDTRKHGLVGPGRWVEIDGVRIHECEHAVEGVVVHGGPLRIIPKVCAKRQCPVHRPPAATKATPDATEATGSASEPAGEPAWKERERKRREAEEAWEAERPELIKQFAAHVADVEISIDMVKQLIPMDGYFQTETIAALGEKWEPEGIAQYLIVHALHGSLWTRDRFKQYTAEHGFKMPRKPRAKAKAKAKKTTAAPATEPDAVAPAAE